MLAANAAHAKAFGTTPEALEGWGVLEVFGAGLRPEVAAFVEAVRTSLERVAATRAPDQMAVRPYSVGGKEGGLEERYWSATNTPILGPDGTLTHILSAAQDVTGEVLERRSETARNLLMREVDHRARNVLTVVQSFVRLTTADKLEDFRRVLDGRVEALARVQTSLASRKWEGAPLREVVEGELASLCEPDKYNLSGPELLLPPGQVQAVSMAIHELATNAMKYGCLSVADGALAVAWALDADGRVTLAWEEASGLGIREPQRQGFGARLISQLARQLGGHIAYDWRACGLRAELRFPLGSR
jgi:two-component sensor histidine kinase